MTREDEKEGRSITKGVVGWREETCINGRLLCRHWDILNPMYSTLAGSQLTVSCSKHPVGKMPPKILEVRNMLGGQEL